MKQSKTAFILAHPNEPAEQIVKEAAKQGMRFTARYVYSIRSKSKAIRGQPRRGPGRPPKSAAVAPSMGGSAEKRFLNLALDLGIGRAEALLKNVRALAWT